LLLLFCLLRKLEPEWILAPEPEVAETRGAATRRRTVRMEEGVASMVVRIRKGGSRLGGMSERLGNEGRELSKPGGRRSGQFVSTESSLPS